MWMYVCLYVCNLRNYWSDFTGIVSPMESYTILRRSHLSTDQVPGGKPKRRERNNETESTQIIEIIK